jgi:hypothetical protein
MPQRKIIGADIMTVLSHSARGMFVAAN